MNPDTLIGALAIGAALIALGPYVMFRAMRETATDETEPPALPTTQAPRHVSFDAHADHALAIAAHTHHAMTRLAVVPPLDQPYDQETDR